MPTTDETSADVTFDDRRTDEAVREPIPLIPGSNRNEGGEAPVDGDGKPGRTMVGSIAELRRRCQEPMEDFNDPLGRLVGSRVSIYVTWLCLKLGIQANSVSYAMLGSGLIGGILLVFGGPYSVLGFLCLVAYYIFDCVDGEVARFRGQTNIQMAAFDHLCHVAVKGVTYAGLGLGLFLELGEIYALVFCLLAMMASSLQKALGEIPSLVFTGKILAQRHHLDGRTILRNMGPLHEKPARSEGPRNGVRPELIPFLSQVRFLFLNFDFAMFLFLFAAGLDSLWLAGGEAWAVGGIAFNAKSLLAVAYGIVLPLNFLDHVATFVRCRRLGRDLREYASMSRDFGADED